MSVRSLGGGVVGRRHGGGGAAAFIHGGGAFVGGVGTNGSGTLAGFSDGLGTAGSGSLPVCGSHATHAQAQYPSPQ